MNFFESSGHSGGGKPWWNGKLRYVPILLIAFCLALGGGQLRGLTGDSEPGTATETTIAADSGTDTANDAASEGAAETAASGNTADSAGSSGGSVASDAGGIISQADSTGSGSVSGDGAGTYSTSGDGSGTGSTVGSAGTSATVSADNEAGQSAGTVTVYVCGSVRYPGVYDLDTTDRVMDAVNAAGGFLDEADTEYWNLAEPLADGEQIRIPTKEESESMEARTTVTSGGTSGTTGGTSDGASGTTGGSSNGTSGGSADGTSGTLVDLNTADSAELQTLTGIGESRAAAIIAYREENGPFQSIEEIMNVSGIKEASFAKIKDQITVGG